MTDTTSREMCELRGRVWAIDEHRIGLLLLIRRVWPPMRTRPIAPVQQEIIPELLEKRVSYAAIARILGVNRETLTTFLRRHGLQTQIH